MRIEFTPDPTLFPFESRFFESSVGRIHYIDAGDGIPNLLLHGNPTWSFLYRKIVPRLQDGFRCIADPDNRLVADTLESDWNDSLRSLQATQDDYERAATTARAALDDDHKARIRALASDFPALWADAATPQRECKRMARLLHRRRDPHQERQDPPSCALSRWADHQPRDSHPADRVGGPSDPPRHPRRARPAS